MTKRKIFSLNKDLQEGLTQTMTAVKHYAGELHFEIIPLHQIELDPDNPRDLSLEFTDLPQGPQSHDPLYEQKMADIMQLNSLAETINSQGLINPILVYKYGNKYRLIAGERRCLASKIAGKFDIKANILNERPTDYRQRLLQWIENVEREDLSLWERLNNIKMILNAYQKQNNSTDNINPTLIKNILNCSMPQANNYFVVLNAPSAVLNAIENNQLRNLEKAAFIARISSNEVQQQLLHANVEGASLKQLKQLNDKALQIFQQQKKHKTAVKLANGRGRRPARVDLGSISQIGVVKAIIEAVIEQDRYRHYHSRFAKVNWNDFAAVTVAFKELLIIMQNIETQ